MFLGVISEITFSAITFAQHDAWFALSHGRSLQQVTPSERRIPVSLRYKQ
jgi:hypothetical protein